MILFVTFLIALTITVIVAAAARRSYPGIVISRMSVFLVFLGAFILTNESARILLVGSVDYTAFIQIAIGLLVQSYGAHLMTKEARNAKV